MPLARRSLQVVAFICTLMVGVASMVVIVTQTTWFKEWLRGFIVRQAEDYVNGRLSIGRLDGNLFFGVELEDVDFTMNGKTVVDIKDVGLDYNVFTFLAGHVVLDDIRLNQPVFHVEKDHDGWNFARLIRARTPDPDEPKARRPIEIGEIGVSDGTLYVEEGAVGTTGFEVPSRIERVDASVAVTSDEDQLRVEIAHVSLRTAEPAFGVNALSGIVRRTANTVTLEGVSLRTEETSLSVDGTIRNIEGGTREVDLAATSDKFDVQEFASLIPALRRYDIQPAFEITARGPIDRMAVDLNVREANLGNVIGDLIVDASGPDRRIAGHVSTEHFNVAPVLGPAQSRPVTSDVTGDADIDLVLPSDRGIVNGTYRMRASRASVAGYEVRDLIARGRIDGRVIQVNAKGAGYGGTATAVGRIVAARPLTLDLQGEAADVDLRNLPPVLRMPGVPSDLQFGYTLRGRGRTYSGDLRLDESTLAGATIGAGSTAQFTIGGGAPSYAAKGQVSNLDVEQIGRGFGIGAISDERYRSRLNATFDVSGSGGGRYPLALDVTGTAVDSEMFGASFPQMDFTTHFAGGNAQIRAIGQFAGLDPAVVTGNGRVAGDLTGAVDVDTTLHNYAEGVTADTFDVSGRINLGRSTFANIPIDAAAIDGVYANREGQITQFSVSGPDLNASGNGTLALNDTGASSLTAHIESPSLDRFAETVGRPFKGAAIVDATLTGNARELKAAGTLQGSNIGYGEHEALSLNSTFEVTVPELTPEKATVQAKSSATFVEIAGQDINALTAETTYSESKLDFNAVATQGARQLEGRGSAVFHPDHQEVHLGSLALRAEQIEWQMTPGTETTIQYGKERIHIDNLEITSSGGQRIQADGVLGSQSEELLVRTENVDVAQLDRLFLGDERLAGRLNANARVTGPVDAPRAEGEFALTEGAFRQFKFESLTGKVEYVGRGMNVSVRLQQSSNSWLTAEGYAPLSLFRPNPAGTAGHETAAPGEAIDLTVMSSQVDLGVVQGFTSYVTNVTGTLKANVRVTGTGHDPHFAGEVDIRGGALSIPDLGTAYTGLDTRIALATDAVTISEMRIVDEHQKVMTIGGTLAVHERAVGAVDVNVKSEDFEVVDNQFADLKLDTDLRVTGELRAPRFEGFVQVEAGTIDVGRLLEEVTSDPYATRAVELNPDAPVPAGEAPTVPRTPIFDAVDLNVGVSVPSNLVLRGTDLRPVNAPIDFGDMNATVGGLVQVRKTPMGDLQIFGEVNTVRGSYTFQGRRFEILRDGRIRFAGTDEIDPLVDVRARREISGVETFVRVQGTFRQPELTFTSNPPLDQADILSLIVFNLPINELGEGEQVSLVQRAGALAGGYLVSGLTQSVANALELDELEIQAAGERDLTASLTIGEQIGERTYFRIRQGFGAQQATELILEYQIADFLRLQGALADTSGGSQRVTFRRIERAGLDLIFFFSY